MIDHYDWAGGREATIRLGPAERPVVIVALPFFEEANRTRTFAMTVMRLLADRGIASVLPDLPGAGESTVATVDATLERWRSAFAAAALASGARYGVAVRSGALVDRAADLAARWHFAPQPGATLVRELDRVRQAAGGGESDESVVEIAGNRLSRHLLGEIGAATAAEGARTVRLANDAQPADRKIDASPLWRRAEPDNDLVLAEILAEDIADWIATCGG